MILVLAGTQDGRQLAGQLVDQGWDVIVSVTTDYGRHLIDNRRLTVNAAPLDERQLSEFIAARNIRTVVDASHPYAQGITRNAITVCRQTAIDYIRYERPSDALPCYDKLHRTADYQTAACTAANLGRTIFLTTGSRHLAVFKAESSLAACRLIARVLPDSTVLAECSRLGFQPSDIVAMQGPFSHALNVALFKHYQADVIITKDSGRTGGSHTKLTAAIQLNLAIVVIQRPTINYPAVADSAAGIIEFLQRGASLCNS